MDKMLFNPKCRLVTFSILYHLPDYQNIINEFIMQQFDLVPELPRLIAFLDFWDDKIEGPIKSVQVAWSGIRYSRSIRSIDSSRYIH